jgi:hypothetical protein
VVGGSLSGADLPYLQSLFSHGAARWMDAVSIHPYSWGWTPESSLLVDELRGIAQTVKHAGLPAGLWITEIGISSAGVLQDSLLERTCILLEQSGVVDKWFWFCLYLADPSGYPIFRTDWQPRPSRAALARVARQLQAATPRGSGLPADLKQPWAAGSPHAHAPLQSWCFQRDAQVQRASWSPGGPVVVLNSAGKRILGRTVLWEPISEEPR